MPARRKTDAAVAALVEQHIGIVRPIARRIQRTLPPAFDLDDLEATGHLALIEAARRYKPAAHGGAPFEAYARRRVDGAIRDSARRGRYADNVRPSIEDVETPSETPNYAEWLDLKAAVQVVIDTGLKVLSPLQARIMKTFYSPDLPNLHEVAELLEIPYWRAVREHREAVVALRAVLNPAGIDRAA